MLDIIKERLRARLERPPDPPGVIPESLVSSAKIASWLAYFALVYFLWLYVLDIARDRAAALSLSQAGTWAGEWNFWFPYIVGFAVVAVGIPWVAKIAIPVFMSLSWKGNFWPKLWALVIAVSVSTVIIAGTFAVQADTLLERDRGSAIAVDQVAQEAAVLEARIADRRSEINDMVQNASVYVRTAASMSPQAYEAFLAEREGDWQYDRLASYRATSVDAQRLRDEIAALREQQARQTVASAVVGRVETAGTSWIGATLDWLEGARAILLSLVMDLVCLIMPWIALRLEQARAQQLQGYVPAPPPAFTVDEDHMIPDLRAEPPIAAEVDAYFEDVAAKRSEAAKKGWTKRKMRVQTRAGAFETDGVIEERQVQSPSDARVVRDPEPAPTTPQEDPIEDDVLALYAEETELPNGEGVMVSAPEAAIRENNALPQEPTWQGGTAQST